MEKPPDTKLTPAIALELCQRTGSAAFVEGSIAEIGKQYLLTAKAVNCSSGETIASAQAQAPDKDHVLDSLGSVTTRLRSKLGESPISVQKYSLPLEQSDHAVTAGITGICPGGKGLREKGGTAPIPFLKRAIELDPNLLLLTLI